MALGLGSHGEPGIREETTASASQLAKLLVGKLAAERPAGTTKVAALLNGLGATKYEELFVLWQAVASELAAIDLEVVEPEAGEFVTSLDMQGCSLSLLWLNDELESYWRAPSDAPVLRRGSIIDAKPAAEVPEDREGPLAFSAASTESKTGGRCISTLMSSVASML